MTENTDLVDKIAVRDADIVDLSSQFPQGRPSTGGQHEREEASSNALDPFELRALIVELRTAQDESMQALLCETRDRLQRHEEATQSAI